MESTTQAAKVGAIFGEAFVNYVLMDHAFPTIKDEERVKKLTAMYTKCTTVAEKSGGILTTPDESGALIWLKHGDVGAFHWSLVPVPFLIGVQATWRLVRHDEEAEGWIVKHSGENMGYLWTIGVTSLGRGKGHGRQLIEKCLGEMKAAGLTECWLKTENEVNVKIYSKVGFRVVHELIVQSSQLKCWIMKIDNF